MVTVKDLLEALNGVRDDCYMDEFDGRNLLVDGWIDLDELASRLNAQTGE